MSSIPQLKATAMRAFKPEFMIDKKAAAGVFS